MASSNSIELMLDGLKTKIWASAFHTALSGRIAYERLEADVALPCCVYTVRDVRIERYMGGLEKISATAEFTISGSGKTNTQDIYTLQESLRGVLMTGSYTVAPLDRMTVYRTTTGAPSFEDECWSITDRYSLISFRP